MIHFNRKTEYALISIQHMASKGGENQVVTSAREMSECYRIPYPLLAKILQKLAGRGLIKAARGTKGGYLLVKKPGDITVADIVEIFDGTFAVAGCFKEERITCPQWGECRIKDPFYELNQKIRALLTQTTIADLAVKKSGGL